MASWAWTRGPTGWRSRMPGPLENAGKLPRRPTESKLNGKDLSRYVCQAAKSSSSSVVAIIESGISTGDLLTALRTSVSRDFYHPICTEGRFQLLCRDSALDLQEIFQGNRVSLRRLNRNGTELILGVVHGVDMNHYDKETQLIETTLLAKEIQRMEIAKEHDRTIIIGYFNMNPFDLCMNKAAGLNAMMASSCTEKGKRTLQNIKYNYFYNPMWNLLGDRTPGPAGTFYHTSSTKGHYGWNMLDQVLVRPSALPWFWQRGNLDQGRRRSLGHGTRSAGQGEGFRPFPNPSRFEMRAK